MKSFVLFITTAFSIFHSYAQEIHVPLSGNAWETNNVISTYVFLHKPGTVEVNANINVSSKQKLICTIGKQTKQTTVQAGKKTSSLGKFNITDTGYIKIDVSNLKIDELILTGTAIDENTSFVKNNEGNFFYWGRRGPSVHLNYDLKEVHGDIEYFYNEIIVPEHNDVIGSYFMANGFAEGYFGMQVNSATERRILFSVWSPFNTDDPKSIPEDKKIKLINKGESVYTGEFGNEGSGGQSYLKYYWNAGDTCRFLLRAKKEDNNYTNYTAWFYLPKEKHWKLIASFSRPYTSTYLKRLHSFLENFMPNTGNITRKAYYTNQWARTTDGQWHAINKSTFTYDATAKKQYRLDYAGGTEGASFYLQNCGFFDQRTLFQSVFTRSSIATPPNINFNELQ